MIMVILHQVPTERSPNPDVGNVVWCVRDDGGFSGFFESVDYNSYGKYLEILYSKLFHGYTSTFTINLGQADYWWLRSPSTRYGYDNSAYAINLNGIETDDYANITVNHSSYGNYIALRIVIITVFLMAVRRIWYENMAVLIIIIAVQKVMVVMSTIPTGISRAN